MKTFKAILAEAKTEYRYILQVPKKNMKDVESIFKELEKELGGFKRNFDEKKGRVTGEFAADEKMFNRTEKTLQDIAKDLGLELDFEKEI